jgi:hypothetical protein
MPLAKEVMSSVVVLASQRFSASSAAKVFCIVENAMALTSCGVRKRLRPVKPGSTI